MVKNRLLTLVVLLAFLGPISGVSANPKASAIYFMDPYASQSNLPQRASSVAVDASGGIHAVMEFTVGNAPNITYPVTYGYCPSTCVDLTHWTWVEVGNSGLWGDLGSAKIALTPDGHPRIMWFNDNAGIGSLTAYYYAECDVNCTQGSSWKVVNSALPGNGTAHNNFVSYFTLDENGHPRYVYMGKEVPHYVMCDANCTTSTNWHDYSTMEESVWTPVYSLNLAIGSNGLPQVIGILSGPDDLVYLSCITSPCDTLAKWSSLVHILSLGSTAIDDWWSLKLDSQGRPRVVLYWNSHLTYLWSDVNPLVVTNWQSYNLDLPAGYAVSDSINIQLSLVMDKQDNPHIAFNFEDPAVSDAGLAYLACTANCESDISAVWNIKAIEMGNDLDTIAPVPWAYPSCNVQHWTDDGRYAFLALDAANNPVITFLAYNTQWGPTGSKCASMVRARTALRLYTEASTLPPGSKYQNYLPMIKK